MATDDPDDPDSHNDVSADASAEEATSLARPQALAGPTHRVHAARHRSHVRRRGGTNPWYGTDIKFQRALAAGLDDHVEHRGQVTAGLADTTVAVRHSRSRVLVYKHAGLDVPARRDPVMVRIEFHESPTYDTYGLAAIDYPRVFADPGASSKHRLPGDALCLWFPRDPDDRRWHHHDGLLALLNTVRNHLFFEDHWRATGGHGGPGQREGIWLGDEAPHGFGQEDAA